MTAAEPCAVVELFPPEVLLELPPLAPPLSPLDDPEGPPSGSETGEKQQAPSATLASAATESLDMTHYRAKIQPRARRSRPDEWPTIADAPWHQHPSRGYAP